MILVDERRPHPQGGYWCHLVSDTSLEELHAFASRLGLKREWFQDNSRLPHYDIKTLPKYETALRLGAKAVTTREMLQLVDPRALFLQAETDK